MIFKTQEFKHIVFNLSTQKLEWALEQVDSSWELERVVPYTAYDAVAVFRKVTTQRSAK